MRVFCLGGMRWGRLDGLAKKANTNSTGNGTHWLVSKRCVMGLMVACGGWVEGMAQLGSDGSQNRLDSDNVRSTGAITQVLPKPVSDSPEQSLAEPKRHNQWLVLIAAYKLVQALLFIAIGVGALRLLHKDIGDVLGQLADRLRFNPESKFVNFILDRASLINDPMLRRIGAAAFCYATLSMVEGIGLYFEKAWAEYLTLAITASFLPWEIFEIIRRLTITRVGLLVANVLVFIYLMQLVTARNRHTREVPPAS